MRGAQDRDYDVTIRTSAAGAGEESSSLRDFGRLGKSQPRMGSSGRIQFGISYLSNHLFAKCYVSSQPNNVGGGGGHTSYLSFFYTCKIFGE